jgi:hypothetical protein
MMGRVVSGALMLPGIGSVAKSVKVGSSGQGQAQDELRCAQSDYSGGEQEE